MDSINPIRRKALKRIGATAVGMAGASVVTGDRVERVAANSTPEEHHPDTTKAENNAGSDIGVYLGVDVGEFGAQWDGTRGVWEYHFKISSTGCSEYTDGGDLNAIRAQRLMVDQGSTNAVWKSSSPEYLGVHPKIHTDDYDYTDVAWDLAEVAVSELSTLADFALTVTDIMDKMHNDTGDENGGYEIDHHWDYNGVYGDVTNFMWWIVEVNQGERGYFEVKSKLDGTYDNNCELTMAFNIGEDGPSPVESANNGGFGHPEKFTEEQMERYGVEIIPREKIKQRAKDLNLPQKSVAQMQSSNGPAYFAHNPPCELVSVKKRPERAT
jgi:hypothetical protein